MALSREAYRRYSRHLILPEVGVKGQERLQHGSVLVVGMGGLGSPVALYLAAAGVGRLGLVDADTVEESNLQRQVAHTSARVGRPKVDSAREAVEALNPDVTVEPHNLRLTADNINQILGGYDIIIDGTDNFPTRYLLNDAAFLARKPLVYGSIFRFEGQASVFEPGKGCYRCLYPEPPPPGFVPSCAEGGVLGVLPGVIGVIQATEAVKLLLGRGRSLAGRLLLYNALDMSFREIEARRDPHCPLCGDRPTITSLIEYDAFCGIHRDPAGGKWDITPAGLQGLLKARSVHLLDVRTRAEFEIVRLDGARHIPLAELPERVGELDSSDDLVVYCHHGGRSEQAVSLLHGLGFTRVSNLAGGIDAWAEEVDGGMVRY